VDTLRLFAPAKVNLVLEVLGYRPDGFHELASIFTPLDFGDTVTLSLLEEPEVRFRAQGYPVPTTEGNLAMQAVRLLEKRFGKRSGVEIVLEKRIPVEAGLGGGSSDAAAVLRGLNLLWGLRLSPEVLANLGAELGSDVPFFLWESFAWVGGRGERVKSFVPKGKSPFRLLLVKPQASLATRDVFHRFRASGHPFSNGARARALEAALRAGDWEALPELVSNDLEETATFLLPTNQEVKNTLRKLSARAAFLTGSGPTCVGVFHQQEKLAQAHRVLAREFSFVREAAMGERPLVENMDLEEVTPWQENQG